MTNDLMTNRKQSRISEMFVLWIISTAFIVSDWMLGLFSFSEYLLVPLFFYILFSSWNLIDRQMLTSFMGLEAVVLASIVLNIFFNPAFDLRPAAAAFLKLSFYLAFVLLFLHYIKHHGLEQKFLKILNYTAVFSVLVGIYIMVALYLDGDLPYRFFWTFTRTDYQSYYFRGPDSLIRMRSVFSEPAHLGYYLNAILGINLFGGLRGRPYWHFNLILTVGIVATSSYSTIAIMGILYLIRLAEWLKNSKTVIFDKKAVLILAIILLTVFLSRNILYETVLLRTADLFSGQDNSFMERIFGSWQYISMDNLLIGNGIGNTPFIWNIYAYILSDLGLIPFLLLIILSIVLLVKNTGLGVLFVLQNFQKGGYLAPAFWLFVLLILLFYKKSERRATALPSFLI